jgi:SNF2 family DNA or RNA helicase
MDGKVCRTKPMMKAYLVKRHREKLQKLASELLETNRSITINKADDEGNERTDEELALQLALSEYDEAVASGSMTAAASTPSRTTISRRTNLNYNRKPSPRPENNSVSPLSRFGGSSNSSKRRKVFDSLANVLDNSNSSITGKSANHRHTHSALSAFARPRATAIASAADRDSDSDSDRSNRGEAEALEAALKAAADEKAYRELRLQKLLEKTDKIVSKLSRMMESVVTTCRKQEEIEAAAEAATEANNPAPEAGLANDTTKNTNSATTTTSTENSRNLSLPKVATKPNEISQPAMLQNVQLRGYQLGGVEWLSSLHSSGLNGILAGTAYCVLCVYRTAVPPFTGSSSFLCLRTVSVCVCV